MACTGSGPSLETIQADGTDGNCVTFVLHDEDHTLGNSLRYMVMKNPDVEFCGYCITHPSESKINFRIQTRGSAVLSPFAEPQRLLPEFCSSCSRNAASLGRGPSCCGAIPERAE
ncbi:DNA-directed RNA polymerases I and III subunit RPAC2-like isoform X1 [Vidua macroura]|uniref:DNA-directed RNA polymerases I and III subunit RPAC2-like isoform X1 n=1 Tax=Vidua macroura TaxID=187451 RepID=UPI0023A8F788|nr:DNA-directed RNA polymerases I and III subunit RPAC2-like isoform X1 [Vidua macroura]